METTDYCSSELAKKLKERGFDEPCQMYYTHEDAPDGAVWLTGDPRTPRNYNGMQDGCPFAKPICSAPTLWQAQKWLREKWGIHVDACAFSDYSADADGNVCDRWNFWGFDLYVIVGGKKMIDDDGEYDSYEQALSAGIAAALELIKRRAKKS